MSKKKKEIKGLERKVKQFIGNQFNKEFNFKQLSYSIGVNDTKGRDDIVGIINKFLKEEKIMKLGRGRFVAQKIKQNRAEGVLEITSTGRGYVVCEEMEADVLVEQRNLNKGFNGDRVTVAVGRMNNKNKYEGRVVEVIERKKEVFVGVFQRSKDYAFVNTRNARMYTDFFIDKEEMKNYKEGEKVAVKIKSWESSKNSPEGEIIKSFGFGDDLLDAYSILYEYGLSTEFDDKVEEEAEKIKPTIKKEEVKKRRDMRQETTFTIDPEDAKDFDDAISFRKINKNTQEVGIHIADVSHYVKPGSKIDEEAQNRATSVYLVDRVIPMLPETLSNNLCSLRPDEEKLTFSAVFILDNNGDVKEEWFGKTVTKSDCRLSYDEAQYIIENKESTIPSESTILKKVKKVKKEITEGIVDSLFSIIYWASS